MNHAHITTQKVKKQVDDAYMKLYLNKNSYKIGLITYISITFQYNLIQLDGVLDPRSLGYRRRLPHPRLECCSFCPGLPSDADGMIHTNQAVN